MAIRFESRAAAPGGAAGARVDQGGGRRPRPAGLNRGARSHRATRPTRRSARRRASLRAWLWLGGALALGCGAAQSPAETSGEALPLEVELRANRIVFNHRIVFAHDSERILEPSFEVLDRVAEVLAEHPNIVRIQVQGHSSTDGDPAHNQDLSARRAESVAVYLREAGVAQEVTSQGYGETYPLCHEDTDECHRRNRRVEFFVDER